MTGDTLPQNNGGDVNTVLNGMFDLFEDKPAVTAAKPEKKPKQEALVLPKANVTTDQTATKKKNLFKQIFGGIGDVSQSPSQAEVPKKKKKKKNFLDSIF